MHTYIQFSILSSHIQQIPQQCPPEVPLQRKGFARGIFLFLFHPAPCKATSHITRILRVIDIFYKHNNFFIPLYSDLVVPPTLFSYLLQPQKPSSDLKIKHKFGLENSSGRAGLSDPSAINILTRENKQAKIQKTLTQIAHPTVIFQLMLSVQHSSSRTLSEELVNGLLVLAQTGTAENTNGEANIASLCQRLQDRQSCSCIY